MENRVGVQLRFLSSTCPSPLRWQGRGSTSRPLRRADVPLYDSTTDSPTHRLSFRPTLVFVAAPILNLRIVQNGASKTNARTDTLLDAPPFRHGGTYGNEGNANGELFHRAIQNTSIDVYRRTLEQSAIIFSWLFKVEDFLL